MTALINSAATLADAYCDDVTISSLFDSGAAQRNKPSKLLSSGIEFSRRNCHRPLLFCLLSYLTAHLSMADSCSVSGTCPMNMYAIIYTARYIYSKINVALLRLRQLNIVYVCQTGLSRPDLGGQFFAIIRCIALHIVEHL